MNDFPHTLLLYNIPASHRITQDPHYRLERDSLAFLIPLHSLTLMEWHWSSRIPHNCSLVLLPSVDPGAFRLHAHTRGVQTKVHQAQETKQMIHANIGSLEPESLTLSVFVGLCVIKTLFTWHSPHRNLFIWLLHHGTEIMLLFSHVDLSIYLLWIEKFWLQ